MPEANPEMPTRLADLVASRLCHDLVNPLGAIGNGVELLEMTGKADGPEMDLIRDAVRAAEARIRLFRLAFGAAGPDQTTSAREAREAVEGYFRQSRIKAAWQVAGDHARRDIKLATLMVLCAETALPMGGEVNVSLDADQCWTLTAQGPRLTVNAELWDMLRVGRVPQMMAFRPADAQFPLLLHTAAAGGKGIYFRADQASLTVMAR
ncbi:histidine phosphotransferase [Rhodobacterales bacterium HKCCE4037]|nr:histidine phosphotransferase [Rhodobacterales bacterium HKCCE4037]